MILKLKLEKLVNQKKGYPGSFYLLKRTKRSGETDIHDQLIGKKIQVS